MIFRARIRSIDAGYAATAARMRELALNGFGWRAFHALTEGQDEIALSYWPDAASIRACKAHPEHMQAQRLGRERWNAAYSVQVALIEWEYVMPLTGLPSDG